MASIETKLGLPQRRDLVLRTQTYDPDQKKVITTDTVINPKPYITTVQPRYSNLQVSIEGMDSIFISANDLQVEIPRTYPKEIFNPADKSTVRFYVDVSLDPSNQIIYQDPATKKIDDYSYKLVFVIDEDPVVWKLILTRERDKR